LLLVWWRPLLAVAAAVIVLGAWAGIALLNGLPATTMPLGKSDQGLPIGVQIIGNYLEDRRTIKFGELIERKYGGFTPPPNFA